MPRVPVEGGGVPEGGGPDGAPGVERGDGGVGAEGQREAGAQHRGEGVEGGGPLRAEAFGVHAVGAAPGGVEGGLDGGGEAEFGERGERLVGQGLGVLDPVAGGLDPVEAELVGGGAHARHDGADRGVADGVEAGLEAGLGAGGDVVGDLGGGEVGDAGVRGVGVGVVQAGGVRAERAVDEQVAAGADRAEPPGGLDALGPSSPQ